MTTQLKLSLFLFAFIPWIVVFILWPAFPTVFLAIGTFSFIWFFLSPFVTLLILGPIMEYYHKN